MRVIAGTAKGIPLKSLPGLKTRPTSGKVKEAFFNIIGNQVFDSFFLDLFSGTGGMGIEALSRGGFFSVFVDKERRCKQVIKDNLRRSALLERAEIIVCDAHGALKKLSPRGFQFDIIYIDPPYLYSDFSRLLLELDKLSLVATGGILGVERDSRDLAKWIDSSPFQLWQRKKYGNTQLFLFANV